MKLLIKNIQSILDEKLSLLERGILITIALCKDSDERITLARFKTKCKISSIKLELISLEDKHLIKWSGYKVAKRGILEAKASPDVLDVINFMNGLYNRSFDPGSASSTVNLRNRLKEHSVKDVKLVIANRYKEWKDDETMKIHLNPTTIFRPSKFDKYLEEARSTRVGESFVVASNINLNNGDEITIDIAKTFIDNDTYSIKIYETDGDGNRRSNGVKATRYGRDIRKMINLQKFNSVKTHRYYYLQN